MPGNLPQLTTRRNGSLEGKMGNDECRWETRHTRQHDSRNQSRPILQHVHSQWLCTCWGIGYMLYIACVWHHTEGEIYRQPQESALLAQCGISTTICSLQRQLSACRDSLWCTSTRTQSLMLNTSFIRRTGAYYSAPNKGGVSNWTDVEDYTDS